MTVHPQFKHCVTVFMLRVCSEAERLGCCGHVTAVKSELSQDGDATTTVCQIQQQISPSFTARSCDVTVTSSPAAACSPPAAFNIAHGQYRTCADCGSVWLWTLIRSNFKRICGPRSVKSGKSPDTDCSRMISSLLN